MQPSIRVRHARAADADAIFELAKDLATSFTISRSAFASNFPRLIGRDDVACLVVEDKESVLGYCLAFDHPTFYANGRVTHVEEIAVHVDHRRKGLGRMLMAAVEIWALGRSSRVAGLATRRAAAFYRALKYEESATYFRKVLQEI